MGVDLGVQAVIVRSLRIGRVLRIVKRAKKLQIIFQTLVDSLPSMASLGVLLPASQARRLKLCSEAGNLPSHRLVGLFQGATGTLQRIGKVQTLDGLLDMCLCQIELRHAVLCLGWGLRQFVAAVLPSDQKKQWLCPASF